MEYNIPNIIFYGYYIIYTQYIVRPCMMNIVLYIQVHLRDVYTL